MIQLDTIIEKLSLLFSMEDYETAEKLLISVRKVPDLYNDTIAIFDANLCLYKNDASGMWEAIRRGLKYNASNYELYVLLGEYYLNKNSNQAYLCFENALFYCNNDADQLQIQEFMNTLKTTSAISVRNVSFILLSYNTLDYTKICVESIRENTPASCREIVVVDNASSDGSVEWLREQSDIILQENKENSGFPKGCNEGIAIASKENDIFLLNNDTLLPPNALFWLRMGLYESDEVGTTGSVTNHATNSQGIIFQDPSLENFLLFSSACNLPKKYPYEEISYLVGFALLIKRSVFEKVGTLDERFSPGNYEDNDYGLRVLQAGYKNILCHNSFIVHFGSKSFGKPENRHIELLRKNREKFIDKWHFNPNIYLTPNVNFVDLISEELEKPLEILEIKCGCAATSAFLKRFYPNIKTYGIENDFEKAAIASYFSDVLCADIEICNIPWKENFFDYVIFDNILNQTPELSIMLSKIHHHLKPNGYLLLGIPSIEPVILLESNGYIVDREEHIDNYHFIKAKKYI